MIITFNQSFYLTVIGIAMLIVSVFVPELLSMVLIVFGVYIAGIAVGAEWM